MKRSRSLSGRSVPRAREPKMKRPVAPFSRRAESYVLKTLIRAARFMARNIATIGATRRDSLGRSAVLGASVGRRHMPARSKRRWPVKRVFRAVQNRRLSQFYRLGRVAGRGIIAPRQTNSAHLDRP